MHFLRSEEHIFDSVNASPTSPTCSPKDSPRSTTLLLASPPHHSRLIILNAALPLCYYHFIFPIPPCPTHLLPLSSSPPLSLQTGYPTRTPIYASVLLSRSPLLPLFRRSTPYLLLHFSRPPLPPLFVALASLPLHPRAPSLYLYLEMSSLCTIHHEPLSLCKFRPLLRIVFLVPIYQFSIAEISSCATPFIFANHRLPAVLEIENNGPIAFIAVCFE